MKNKLLIGAVALLAVFAVVVVWQSKGNGEKHSHNDSAESVATQPGTHTPVPAFQTAVVAANLPPTLPANEFYGKTREAYTVAKAIPETLAQLPCYCHCDRGFGHKSLHTCFTDEHASHCAVCVDEALLAYKLQKEEGMTPAKIRETIIAKYSVSD
ncbi:MAG: hypothetical protein DMF69_18640 [Acidobacteria bacterium]|nr:MAG: hypothetical protein DMF69_18640 [Acidobacteriota bacterium]